MQSRQAQRKLDETACPRNGSRWRVLDAVPRAKRDSVVHLRGEVARLDNTSRRCQAQRPSLSFATSPRCDFNTRTSVLYTKPKGHLDEMLRIPAGEEHERRENERRLHDAWNAGQPGSIRVQSQTVQDAKEELGGAAPCKGTARRARRV